MAVLLTMSSSVFAVGYCTVDSEFGRCWRGNTDLYSYYGYLQSKGYTFERIQIAEGIEVENWWKPMMDHIAELQPFEDYINNTVPWNQQRRVPPQGIYTAADLGGKWFDETGKAKSGVSFIAEPEQNLTSNLTMNHGTYVVDANLTVDIIAGDTTGEWGFIVADKDQAAGDMRVYVTDGHALRTSATVGIYSYGEVFAPNGKITLNEYNGIYVHGGTLHLLAKDLVAEASVQDEDGEPVMEVGGYAGGGMGGFGDPQAGAAHLRAETAEINKSLQVYNDGRFTLNAGSDGDWGGVYYGKVIWRGDIQVSNGGSVAAAFGPGSLFDGVAFGAKDTAPENELELFFAGDARWKVNLDGKSTVASPSRVHFENGGIVDLRNGSRLKVRELTGTGGTIEHFSHLTEAGNGAIVEAGSVEGTHTVVLNLEGTAAEDQKFGVNRLVSQQSGDMTLEGTMPGGYLAENGSLDVWRLVFVGQGQTHESLEAMTDEEIKALDNHGAGAGDWYVVRGESSAEPPAPSEPGGVIDVGTTVAQAISWMSEKNDLRRRLGEVRYGSQAGAWAKAFNRKDRASGFSTGGFEQRSTGVHVGYDTLVAQSESSSWLLGATFRYAQSDQDGLETANGGTGEMDEYSGKFYATWMHESGAYADILAQVGYYDQDITGITNDHTGTWKTDYASWGMGASIEIGHMLTLKNGADDRRWFNHWFFEPQAELSYFRIDGASFRLSTGMGVEQEEADFLTGRLGFVLGKKFNYGTADDLDRRYFQMGLIGGVTHEFLGEQEITFTDTAGEKLRVKGEGLGGTSFYYGVTVDWQAADRWRFYAELDREEGDNYTKEYGINVGFKYLID